MLNKALGYGFYLLLALIAVQYFYGTTRVIGAGATAIRDDAYAFSGRNSEGNVSQYPYNPI